MNPYVQPSRYNRRRKLTKLEWVERIWRDLVPAIAVGIAFYAVLGVEGKADKAHVIASQQQEGRRVAVDVLCGGIVGVENAGRLTLLDRLPGLPRSPMSARETRFRQVAARAYTTLISTAVIGQAGIVNGRDVLGADGLLDCDALRRAARAVAPSSP